jgi:hypothetical protein
MISKVGTILSYDGGDTGELPNFFLLYSSNIDNLQEY